MIKKIFGAITLLGLAIGAQAQVTIQLNLDGLLDQLGGYSPTSSLVLVVADVDGNGFGLDSIAAGQSLTAGSYIGDSNDYVVFVGDLSAFSEPGVGQLGVNGAQTTTDWTAGDQLAVVWFPSLTTASATVVDGSSYGYITSTIFVTPANGGTATYQIITAAAKGYSEPDEFTYSASTVEATASFVVGGSAVPEPSTIALVLGGILVLTLFKWRA